MTGRAFSRLRGGRVAFTTCPCPSPKRSYRSRRDARMARRELHDSTLHVYLCTSSGLWHLGHRYPEGDPS